MIRFDADRQRWVDHEAEAAHARQHTRAATQQRQAAKGVLAVLAVCGLAFGTWVLGWEDEPGRSEGNSQPPVVVPEPGGTSRPDRSAPAGDGEEPVPPSDTAGSAQASPPEGYETVEDPEGFTLAVPEGWQRRVEDRDGAQAVYYEKPGGAGQLLVFFVEDSDPYESLELAEKDARKHEEFERDSLDRLDGGDGQAARLEYTYHSEEHGGTRRVIDHRFEAEDGELYAIVSYGQEDEGASEEQKERLETARTFFCPTGVECGEASGGGDGDDGL